MSTKKKMKYIIEEQPDDATYEEILRELAFARMVERIYEKVQILNKLPEIGYRYRATREGDIRVLLYGHYRIAYLLGSHKTISILGIFHSALDVDRYL